ncbi:MAG: tRNA:Cm32/Um32 methyltransferase [Pseudomonadota bacterium]|jgi:tRNA/rRNA methyltransferase
MNLPKIKTSVFHQTRFILVETSHPGNIGAAARAIKTMGFGQLVLLRPRFDDALSHPEAIAFASGALDVLQQAQMVDTIEAALQGVHFAAAVSARLREFSPPVVTPRALAAHITSDAFIEAAQSSALIFGNERYGLPNEVVEKCQALINIPANPEYSSLNLAQAIQVVAYECRMAALEGAGAQPVLTAATVGTIGFQGKSASLEQIEGMYAHLEQALIAIEFLDADNPKKLMPRIKRLFARSGLEQEEVNILRGIASQILQPRARIKREK